MPNIGPLYLHGISAFHPPTIISNAFLESLDIGVDEKWVIDRVGVKARHTVLPLDYIQHTRNEDARAAFEAATHTNARCASAAIHGALRDAGVSSSDVGWLIAGTSSPQYSAPAEAAVIAAEAGLDCVAFDVGSVCATFAFQLALLERLTARAMPDFVVIVQAESMTTTVNYNDRSTAVLFGDCSVAAVLSKTIPSTTIIGDVLIGNDTSGALQIVTRTGRHFLQDGPAVQRFAVSRTSALLREAIAGSNGFDAFIGHQANLRMLESVCQRSGIPAEKHFSNVERRGNCASAGAPSVLSEIIHSSFTGNVILAVVGGGLSWGRMTIGIAAAGVSPDKARHRHRIVA